jgi:hypothetical protein
MIRCDGTRRFHQGSAMKLINTALVLASVLVPAVASAQGYGPPPQGYYAQPSGVPGGFFDRTGRLAWGASLGIGGMSENGTSVSCNSCNYNPAALEGDFHVGGMLSPRFALLFEFQVNAQTIDNNANATTSLSQSAAMVAGQYWLTPQLWIKGGIGVAHLSVDSQDYYGTVTQPVSDGSALMGGVGYELLSARNFAVDVQGRIIAGNYKGIDDHVSSGTVGIGINWY